MSKFQTIVGFDGVERTYEDNRWIESEALYSKIGIEDVLATQSLVMQLLSQQKRSVMRGDKKHGFAALNNIHSNQNEYYDGSLEEYVACRIAKVQHDHWKMRIRFRQNKLAEETRDSSYIDNYSFDWLRNGNVQAWYGNYLVKATPEGTYEMWKNIQAVDEDSLAGLHEQLRQHVTMSVAATALHHSREQNGR